MKLPISYIETLKINILDYLALPNLKNHGSTSKTAYKAFEII